jgi:NAD-dependent dihydropyrimidine dehydrogenase PreA subunit
MLLDIFFFVLLTLNLHRQLDRFLIVIDLDDCIGQNAANQLCQLKYSIICEQEVAELPRVSTDAN